MRSSAKKKLCWNCEGSVSKDADNCPYCAVYLHPAETNEDEDEDDLIIQAPYQFTKAIAENEEIHLPPYPIQEPLKEDQKPSKEVIAAFNSPWFEMKKILTPLSFLLSGSLFLLFGLILLIFSNQGKLILQWNSNYWIFYLGLSLPLLGIGWFSLRSVEDSQEKIINK